jgi:hypothetical protein
MTKTETTWELIKSSWRVLMRDKELLLFPLISGSSATTFATSS